MSAAARVRGLRAHVLRLVLVALFALTRASASQAQRLKTEPTTARFDQTEQALRAHLVARGASSVSALGRDFLFEGKALVRTLRFERTGCRAVLAWGGAGLRDVDLGLYSTDGSLLADDRGATPYAYARLCAAAGARIFASAQAYAGRGEILLYAVEDAPRVFGRPPASLPLAVPAGGQASAPRAMGGDDGMLSFEAPLLHDERELAAAGFVAQGPPSLLEVRAGMASGTLFLRENVCIRVVAFVPHVRGLILSLEQAEKTWEARSADAEIVRISLCPQRTGPVLVSVRTRALRSLALLRVFEHPLARRADADAYDEERAINLAEARTVASERGLVLAHLGEAWLEGEQSPLGWPVKLHGGACHVFAALPQSGLSTELLLVNARGVVLAHNEGRHGVPTLFACAETDESARLFVRKSGGAGAVSLWQGYGGSP